jgi:hypothetical protein
MKNLIVVLFLICSAACRKPATTNCSNAIAGTLKYSPQSGSCMDWYIVTPSGWLMPANLESFLVAPKDNQPVKFSYEYAATPSMNFACNIAPLITITCLDSTVTIR